ncbi:GH92 family glycosyl hydrolase [Chitinophagaceae bacterium MMS25-I14]
MKKVLLAFTLFCSGYTAVHAQKQLSKSVNPFIGTGGHGHTFPGAILPFGMMQLSPDTRLDGWDGCGGYHYSDSVIYGFSHTHLSGTGCSDYGDVLLMPTVTETGIDKYQYASTFSHKNEQANAGYYSVFLNTPGVEAELTATTRCGMHQYTFPKKAAEYLVLDLKHRDEVLDSKLEILDDHTIRGYRFSKAWANNQKLFFEMQFSKPIINQAVFLNDQGTDLKSLEGKNIKARLQFKNDGKPLLVKVAISGTDEWGAHKNLTTEMPGWNFAQYKKDAAAAWDKELSKIEVKGGTKEQQTIFYTALYHAMCAPNIYNDVDGRYRGRDDRIHNTDGKYDYYTVFSLWDTYRAENPLMTIIDRKRTNDFVNTFIKQYEQGGLLPVWELSANETYCMIGYHSVPVIWDAYSKGIRGYDAEKAFEAMKHSAMMDHLGLASYKKYGYVRSDDEHESVSKTLEYAYDDWCIAQMANALGKKDDFAYFMKRSQNWKNVYDPTTGFMRARRNGTLFAPFSPYTVDNNFTEANSWQYSFYVPQDIPGLIAMSGGKDKFEAKLDALFTAKTQTEGREQADITGLIGQYAHGNEPSHHIAYLYNYVGHPEKTQAIIGKVINEFYKNDPDGLIGNEDCGQMSAWYVMSAMGLYQVCPGGGAFDTGDQLFDEIYIHNGTGIDTLNKARRKAQTALQLDVNNHFHPGTSAVVFKERPQIVANPVIVDANRIFKGEQMIDIRCAEPDAEIYYSYNNLEFAKYNRPFPITQDADIRFYSVKGRAESPVQVAHFKRLPDDRTITLHAQYNRQYTAGGPEGLIDGLYGDANWRKGGWQGYQGQDFEAVVAFNDVKKLSSLSADFLQDQRAWIFYPREVSFYASNDSATWELVKTVDTHVADHDENVKSDKFSVQQNIKAKYIKVVAKNFGPMPAWHEGTGNPTFIFVDEIEVK